MLVPPLNHNYIVKDRQILQAILYRGYEQIPAYHLHLHKPLAMLLAPKMQTSELLHPLLRLAIAHLLPLRLYIVNQPDLVRMSVRDELPLLLPPRVLLRLLHNKA